MATTYVTVEFPPPTVVGPACQACEGRGVTGEQYQMPTGEGRVLLVDVFCPSCGGCGSAEHVFCAGLHAGLDAGASIWFDYDYDLDDEEPEDACPSCQGREWNAVQGFGDFTFDEQDGEDVPTSVKVLRVPCGCTTDRARMEVR
jgi:hypothetical protein